MTHMRVAFLALMVVCAGGRLRGQVFVGPDVGGLLGRSIEVGTMVYPKNEDWIAGTFGVGYTVPGPMYFPRKKAECLSGFRNSGWHIRLGLRNTLTTDHHANHFFWGADLMYSRQHERAVLHSCDTATVDPVEAIQSLNVWTAGLYAGYTWNPLRGKTIFQKFLLDFGVRLSYPFHTSVPLLGERDYISGAGFTWMPFRSVAFNPIVAARWELFHGRYGYSKGKTRPQFK